MSKIDPRWHYGLLVFVALAVGFWPFRELMGNYPEGADALKWVTNASPSNPDWMDWVFWRRHFIGYRPVTAFTFTVNSALTGWSPWGYRITNAVLHIATGLAVYGLFRVLTRGRGWWAVLAAAIFYAHPAGETVLPHIARRSYLLGSLFSVSSLIAWTVATRDRESPVSRWALLASVSLGAALLSNEIAYVAVPMFPLFALAFMDRAKPWYDSVVRCIPILVVAVTLIALRFAVLGHFGGYHRRYFAYTRNNHNLIKEIDDTPYSMVIEAAWRYMCFPTAASGDQALLFLGGSVGLVLAIGIVAYYGWRAVVEPALPGKEPTERLVLLMFIWLAGHTLLYALTRNWFWRQSYPMLPPFALLVAMVARETWIRRDDLWKRVLHTVPQGLLAVSILYNAPVVTGIDEDALRGQLKASRIVREVKANLNQEHIESPALVYIALPVRGPSIRDAITWIRREYQPDGIQIRWLSILRLGSKELVDQPTLDLAHEDGRTLIKLRSHMQFDPKLIKSLKLEGKNVVWMDRLNAPGVPHGYVYYATGDSYELAEIPPKTDQFDDENPPPQKKSKRKKKQADRDRAK